MSFVTNILGGSLAKTLSSVGDTVKKFVTTDTDRMNMQTELEKILQERDSNIETTIRSELEAKEKVLVAELSQSDNYTKRARPTVVYFGLVMIFINYCLIPIIQMITHTQIQSLSLPVEFWAAWGGIVATWCIGRSAEKRGSRSKVTSFITGSQYD